MATLLLIERPTDRSWGTGEAFRVHADGSREESAIFPLIKEATIIGRGQYGGVDVCLLYAPVNRMHAAIRLCPDGYYIEDLRSRNGTKLNDTALISETPRKLEDGDRIGILGFVFEFRIENGASEKFSAH